MTTSPGLDLAALRRRRGFSQDALAAELGVTRQTIARWEGANQVGIYPRNGAKLAEILGVAANEINAGTGSDNDTLEIKELLDMANQRSEDFVLQASQTITTELVEQLGDNLARIAADYQRQPLLDIMADLVQTQQTLFVLLERTHLPSAISQQLYFLTGLTEALLAKAAHDRSDPHNAQTHARSAYMAAELAGHNNLKAWIRGLQSMISYWANRPHDAVRFAEAGASINPTGTTAVWVAANEARAWASIGNAANTQTAVSDSQALSENTTLTDLDDLGGLFRFGPNKRRYYTADAYSQLGNTHDAYTHASDAIAGYEHTQAPSDWAFSDLAGSRAVAAIALLQTGDIEGARETLNPVLDLAPAQRINGITKSVDRVRQATTHLGDSRPAQDFTAQLEAFTASPLAALTN